MLTNSGTSQHLVLRVKKNFTSKLTNDNNRPNYKKEKIRKFSKQKDQTSNTKEPSSSSGEIIEFLQVKKRIEMKWAEQQDEPLET